VESVIHGHWLNLAALARSAAISTRSTQSERGWQRQVAEHKSMVLRREKMSGGKPKIDYSGDG